MTEFEPPTSGVGSDRYTKWATATTTKVLTYSSFAGTKMLSYLSCFLINTSWFQKFIYLQDHLPRHGKDFGLQVDLIAVQEFDGPSEESVKKFFELCTQVRQRKQVCDYLPSVWQEVGIKSSHIFSKNSPKLAVAIFIRTKRSERAKQAHSVLREVEKMGYKKFLPVPV